jgi:DNA primase catalytic core
MQVSEAIDRIKDDIVEVIGHYMEIKQERKDFKGCCPFHNEKTPSFSVSESRGRYKCFGCGKGGDAINFIMEHERLEFMDAVREGAKRLNLSVEWKEDKNDFDSEEYKKQESLRILCTRAAEYFQECLHQSPEASKYVTERNFDPQEKEDPFMMGYAPAGNHIMVWATAQGFSRELLLEAGLIAQNDRGEYYDFFRDRIMFPICEKTGKVIGFTGRKINIKNPSSKYLNTPETPIFTKGKALFGINIARQSIRNQNRAYLVEGNFDVRRLHLIGVSNTVAPCGTALTEEQIALLRTLTKNVTLIYDGDAAGTNAINKNGEMLVKAQFNVNVLRLPEGQDPDTAFPDYETFDKFTETSPSKDFIIYKALAGKKKCENPSFKSEYIKEISYLITRYDDVSFHEVYMEEVSNILKPKKAWQDAVRSFMADKAPVERKSNIPSDVSLAEFDERGFFARNNCYWFRNAKGISEQRSNFVMTPLFHVESTINSKRLYVLTNVKNLKRVVEIPQKDLVSLSAFQVHVESEGNFWFDGSQADLNRLKRILYEKTESCKEIIQLGWQKEGFWAWGNGIYNGKYTEADDYGIVRHDERNYYIPATSKIFARDETLYHFERKFVHMENNITLSEYAKRYIKVFGPNAKIALCFYFASIFRDVIVQRFGIFPILNMFGPKGAGKTACAESLVQFFGRLSKAPNVHNTSKPALGEHVASSCNAIAHIDEYRNDIDMEKREFLKGLWDGVGRTKMNMDKDKKKETTSVDQAIVLTGQQMATADIALFSRLIFLSFTQTEYTEAEEKDFVDLKAIEKRGLTHITHQILRLRDTFKEGFDKNIKEVGEQMHKLLGEIQVESRIFNNWLIPLGAYVTIADHLELPWDKEELLRLGVKLMVAQNRETKKNDDLGNFWKVVQYLVSSGVMFEGGDYKIATAGECKRRYFDKEWKSETIPFPKETRMFYMTTNRVFSLYKERCLREGDKPMPESTVEYYLKNSPAFICVAQKENFKKFDIKTGRQEEGEDGSKKHTSTTALVFNLDMIGLSIGDAEAEGNASAAEKSEPEPEPVRPRTVDGTVQDLPF